ncbi:porin family protein [Leeuwenhoekiella palythoae]|uniref:Outer membrane protein beta-barrel domain-containing protein n=1 Tax=Leeuwenhoekiella palythoae TaxID=573501 RepID=A0A1M5VPS1_9FLAO|nr:porin family protein [Leeuwenhoekiella palythoae]RXG31006.1 outer membrane protein with beta-barrel domain [Leeuwenhoekiella palythoae]SHH77227.1 Outer membrane protein beta-barrel domain-containing protein [Leeuwenhoekiella palythoae]
MKKITLFILLFVNLCTAQSKDNLEFGIITALSISNVSDSYNQRTKSLVEFSGGAFGNYYLSDQWSLKLKAIYERKGYAEGLYENRETDVAFNMISVPVTANFYFGNNNNWYINLGPYIGFMIAAKATSFNVDVTRLFNSTDFGIAGGIGYKLPIGENLDVFAEIDNQTGLSDILIDNPGSAVRNNRLSFNLGIIF